MTFMRLIAFLLNGSSEMTMSRSWLADKDQMEQHEAYTDSQLIPGMARIEAGVAEMRRRDFWKALAVQAEERESKVIRFGKAKRA